MALSTAVKQLEGTELRSVPVAPKASILCTLNGPKCSISCRGVHYSTCHIWLSRQLNSERLAGRCKELHYWSQQNVQLGTSSSPLPPPWTLSPTLIRQGASWRGSRTAVQVAAHRLFVSSAAPLPASVAASTTKSQMQTDSLSKHLDTVRQVLLLFPSSIINAEPGVIFRFLHM